MVNPVDKQKSVDLQLVSFWIDGKEYAIDLGKIVEIIYYRSATAFPEAPEFIEGVLDLRGVVIPVLDLRKRLKLSSGTPVESKHILVVRLREKMLGVVVDEVKQVIHIGEGDLQSPQNIVKGAGSKFLRGVCKVDDRLIFVLSFDSLLSDDEKAQLTRI